MNNKLIFGAIILVLLGGGVYAATQNSAPVTDIPEEWACTMDALLCPDGSGVGREGPACTFTACPDQESFTGELTQQGEEWRLVIASPENTGATYALPIEFRVSNAVQDLVGRQVKVRGTFTEGNKLKVDTMEPVAQSENPAPQVNVAVLKVGETKLIGGVKVTLNSIKEDSRCPIDAVCIWAGQVTANVTLLSDTDRETVDITAGKDPHAFASWKISITEVTPSKMASVPADPSEYRVTFKTEPL